MKHIKSTLSVFVFLFCINNLNAQGFYISANAGYAFPMNGQRGLYSDTDSKFIDNNVVNNTSFSTNYGSVNFSIGKGFNFGGTVGFEFNDYLGVELGLDYLLGEKNTVESTLTEIEILQSIKNTYNSKTTNSRYSRMFRVIPRLVISPNFEKLDPYIKIGVVLGFGALYSDYDYESTHRGTLNQTFSKSRKSTGGVAIGFNSSFGVNYNLSDKISLFGEMSYIGMSYAPEKTSVTKWEENGEDVLAFMPTNSKETEYVDELTSVQDSGIKGDEPTKQLYFSQSFSSLGINLGFKFNLSPTK